MQRRLIAGTLLLLLALVQVSFATAPGISISTLNSTDVGANSAPGQWQTVSVMLSVNGSGNGATDTYAVNVVYPGGVVAASNTAVQTGTTTYLTFPACQPVGGPCDTGALSISATAVDTSPTAPFNSVFTSAAVTNTVYKPGIAQLSVSNKSLDLGQNSLLSGDNLALPGQGPFTVNFVYTNNGAVADSLSLSGSSFAANFLFMPTSIGSYTFNIIATDLGTTKPWIFESPSNAVSVNPTLSANTLGISATTFSLGQSATFTGNAIGGTSPYTYNYVVYNAISGAEVYSSSTTNSLPIDAYPISTSDFGVGTFFANVIITDSAPVTESAASASTADFVVNNGLAVSIPYITNGIVDQGQEVSLSESFIASGTPPYSYNWLVEAPGFSSFQAANTVICPINGGTGEVAGNTVTCIFSTGSSTEAGDYAFKFQITDAADATSSSSSNTVQVYNAPTLTALSPSSSSLNAGQSATFTTQLAGGKGPYTVNLVSANGTVWNTIITSSTGQITFGSIIPTQSTTFHATGVDQGTTAQFSFASGAGTVTVSGSFSSTTTTSSGTGPGASGESSSSTTSMGPPGTSAPPPKMSTSTASASSTTTIPIGKTFNASGTKVTLQINVSATNGTLINVNNGTVLLLVSSSKKGPANVIVATLSAGSITPPKNYTAIDAYNVSVNRTGSQSTSVQLTVKYDCSVPGTRVQPYLFSNGTWQEIKPFTLNAGACTVTFSITADPLLALFEAPASSATVSAGTIIPPFTTGQSFSGLYVIIAIVVVIVLILLAYLLTRNRGGSAQQQRQPQQRPPRPVWREGNDA